MTLFFILALAMTAAATLFLVLPLRKKSSISRGDQEENLTILRDQLAQLEIDAQEGRMDADQLKAARLEIERRLLQEEKAITADLAPEAASQDRRIFGPALGIGMGVPLLAVALYVWVGNPFAIDAAQAEREAASRGMPTQQDIEGMVKRLEDRLKSDPKDPKGWQMLARSYAALGRLPEATQAYSQALALSPDDPLLMVDYADLLAFQNKSVKGEPLRLIEKALKLLPDNLKVLALAGTAYYEQGRYDLAERYWAQARALAPPESAFAKGMAENIEAARAAAAQQKK